MPLRTIVYIVLGLFSLPSFSFGDNDTFNVSSSDYLLQHIEIFPDTFCQFTIFEAIKGWNENSWKYSEEAPSYINNLEYNGCLWVKLVLENNKNTIKSGALYFPKSWRYFELFQNYGNGFHSLSLGTNFRQESYYYTVGNNDTIELFVKYPGKHQAGFPAIVPLELSEEDLAIVQKRGRLKFLIFGIMIFPLFFFIAQIVVHKEKISIFYFLFLLGSTAHLITILDETPFFDATAKIISDVRIIQHLFLISTFVLFWGLIKFIQHLLHIPDWSKTIVKVGDYLLWIFLLIGLYPIIFQKTFYFEHYGSYLQYFRLWALVTFLYVVWINVIALIKKVQYSRILLLAFTPLIASGIYYVLSFLIKGGYVWMNASSIILISGFLMTIFMFGAILGYRNKYVRDKNLILEQSTRQLKELDAFKSRFYTNITHEFRTPLTIIKGMTNQLKGPDKALDMIHRNSDRLLNLINQLLDLSKIENNQISIHKLNGNVVPYLQYYIESMQSWAMNMDINLSFYASDEVIKMDFDEDKLQKIVINLVSNAIKHGTRYSSVKVIASKILKSNNKFLEIKIIDTGKGIPPEDLPHIFELFYQSGQIKHQKEKETTSQFHKDSGSGIGLALVKELVEVLEGEIKVESKMEKGTTFIVCLPIHNMAKPMEQMNIPAHLPILNFRQDPEESYATLNKFVDDERPQLLIIEDNMDVVEYIISCVQKDYDWKYARDGKTGLEDAIEFIPDVIICDLMIPEKSGFEVCEILKSDVKTSHIPIIILTAKATQEDKIRGLSLGANAFITKPFDKEELLIRLGNLSREHQQFVEHLKFAMLNEAKDETSENKESVFLREVNAIILEHMDNDMFDTNFLCRKVGMSRTQLHRKLKALTSQSTASFIRSKRLEKARYFLETTDLSIGEIAYRVGYKDFSHFSKSFFKEFDLKPSDLRL